MKQADFNFENLKEDNPEQEWTDMPEFIQANKEAVKRVTINFESEDDLMKFNKLTGLTITMKTKGVFFPPSSPQRVEYVDES